MKKDAEDRSRDRKQSFDDLFVEFFKNEEGG